MESRTYKLDEKRQVIDEFIDDKEAIMQAIRNIVYTPRYDFEIYSFNYGCEITKLLGKNSKENFGLIEGYITDALLCDERIEKIEDFSIKNLKGKVEIRFKAVTQKGAFEMKMEV